MSEDYKARCEFLQAELEEAYKRLLHTQTIALQAQEIAIDRGWQLFEAKKKLNELGIKA